MTNLINDINKLKHNDTNNSALYSLLISDIRKEHEKEFTKKVDGKPTYIKVDDLEIPTYIGLSVLFKYYKTACDNYVLYKDKNVSNKMKESRREKLIWSMLINKYSINNVKLELIINSIVEDIDMTKLKNPKMLIGIVFNKLDNNNNGEFRGLYNKQLATSIINSYL